jgi:type I restriction enzyme S subunit
MSDDLDFKIEVVETDELDELDASGAQNSKGSVDTTQDLETEDLRGSKLREETDSEGITSDEAALAINPNVEGWSRISLGEISSFQNGNAFSKSDWAEDGYPIIRIQNLTGEADEYNYYGGDLEHRYRVDPGDTLLTWSGTLGVFKWDGPTAALNQHIFNVETREEVNDSFFHFKLEELIPQLVALSHGSTMKHVRKADLVNIDVDLPPLPEQRKIASVLYTIDQAIQKTEEIIEQAKQMKRGLMQKLFREGLRDGPQKEIRRIGKIPSEWEVVRLGEVCDRITDGTHQSPETKEEGFPYITSQNIRNWGFDLSVIKYISKEAHEKITARCSPQKGDVLYVKDGANTGTVQVNTLDYEFSLLSSVALIRPTTEVLDPLYLKHLLSWPKIRQLMMSRMSGTGISRLTISKIQKSEILLPAIEEQRRIRDILNTFDDTVVREKRHLSNLRRLKKGLIQDLFTGEVRTADKAIDVLDEVVAHG